MRSDDISPFLSPSLRSTQLKTARGEIARVDAKVDSVEKSVRAEIAEVDQRHTKNFKEASGRIHVLELAKEEFREEIDAMKPRISTLEEDSAATKATVANHGERCVQRFVCAHLGSAMLQASGCDMPPGVTMKHRQANGDRRIAGRNAHTAEKTRRYHRGSRPCRHQNSTRQDG